jgi:plastocyanin
MMKHHLLILLLLPITVIAAEADYVIVIKDHHFLPAELNVPAGKKIKLLIENQDATPEEFESHTLNREKIIAGKSKATIYVGPLEPGSYKFFGEFNEATAQGLLIAK